MDGYMKKAYRSARFDVLELSRKDEIMTVLISGINGDDFFEDDNNWADGPIPTRG